MNAQASMPQSSEQPVGLRLEGAMLTDVGCVRPHNEDAVAFVVPAQGATTAKQDGLALVADGMGGHAAGEVASTLAAEVVRRVFYELKGSVPDVLSTAFNAANRAISEYSASHPECVGMGTTCTALAVRGDKAWLGHVGDSRAYLLRAGKLTQLSQDQTLVAKMVREGLLTEEEAKVSEHNNIILQALGTQPQIEPEIWSEGLPLIPGDVMILCSDGLHGLVPDEMIAEISSRSAPMEACQSLIASALGAGGHDNVSVGVFRAERAIADPVDATQRDTRRVQVRADLLSAEEPELSAATTRQITIPRRPL
jgi:serine/threonine protein phosphatase PrpC